jgi:hypothetical protein
LGVADQRGVIRSGGDNILIAGTTDYDTNTAAPLSLMQEWTRTDENFPTRVAHLRAGVGPGPSYRLTLPPGHLVGGEPGRPRHPGRRHPGVIQVCRTPVRNSRPSS